MFSKDPYLAEYQAALLDHMRLVCSRLQYYGIWYSLSSGTLLGAIRQEGFIEWDDDLDLMIRLEDRDRVVQVLKDVSGVVVRTINTAFLKTWDMRYDVEFKNGAIGHPSMDIFCMGPADIRKMPYLEWQFKRVISFAAFGQTHAAWEIPTVAAPYEWFRRIFLTRVDFLAMHNRYVEQALVKNRSEGIYSDLANFSWARREWFSADNWDVVRVKFEGVSFNALSNYEQLLVNQYGPNWRTPPKKRSLTSTHVANRMISVKRKED